MTLEDKAAVVLNINAMRVNQEVRNYFKRYHSKQFFVYESSSLEELEDIIKDISKEKFSSIIAAGGDGNVFSILNALQKTPSRDIPTIDIVALGTGNGLANLVGATKNYREEIYDRFRVKDFREQKIREFPLIEISSKGSSEDWSEPVFYTFAGSGLDATVLNDYNELKKKNNKDWQKFYSHGLPGYFIASFFKTLPKIRNNKFLGVSIYLNDGEIFRIGKKERNEIEKLEISQGQEISMVGDVQGISVGTTPDYGYNLKAHPYALFGEEFSGGMFQLRTVVGNPLKIASSLLVNLPSLWRGTVRSKYIRDYFAKDVTIKYWVEDTPSQVAGEPMGLKREIRYKFSDKNIKLVDKRD